MNNDTISRSALKNDLKQYFSDGVLDSVSAKLAFNMILRKIDNAPTVDINTELSVAYLKGRRQGQSEERPQGEWIKKYKGQVNSFCSECDYEVGKITNFCPNCGADMRKGGAE